MTAPLTLVLAPHFDDAVVSLGGVLQEIRDRVLVVTVFSRSNWTRDGIAVGHEYEISALRLGEERDALGALGVRGHRALGYLEAPLRGHAFAQIFDGRALETEAVLPSLAGGLDQLVAELSPALVLAPLGLGRHIDHRLVSYVAQTKLRRSAAVMFYEDLPYANRASEQLIVQRAAGRRAWRVPLSEAQLDAKLAALACYRSQLSEDDTKAVVTHARRRGAREERLYGDVTQAESIAWPGQPIPVSDSVGFI